MTRPVLPRCVVLAAVATAVLVVAASCVQVAHGGRPKGFITRDDMEEFVEWFEEEGGVLHSGATYDLVQPGKDAGQGDDDDDDEDDDDDAEAGRRLTGSKAPLAFASDVPYVRVVTTESGSVTGGEVVVAVPRHLLLYVRPWDIGSDPKERKLPSEWSDTERLAYMLAEEARDPRSFWAPYFAVLPRSFDSPINWGDAQMMLLADTDKYGFAATVSNDERRAFQRFVERANSLPKVPSLRPYQSFSRGVLRWAWGVVASRGFLLTPRDLGLPEDADPLAHPLLNRPFLAPGADFLNHAGTGRLKLQLDPAKKIDESPEALAKAKKKRKKKSSKSKTKKSKKSKKKKKSKKDLIARRRRAAAKLPSFQLVTGNNYNSSQEIFYNYHNQPNAYVLNNYGFIIDGNPYDFMPVVLNAPVQRGTELQRMKIQLLRHLKLIDGLEPVVKLREPGLTIATQNVLRVLGLNGTVGEETHEEWIKIDCHTKPLTVDDHTFARGLGLLLEALQRFDWHYDNHETYTKTGTGDVGAITRMQEIEWLVDPTSTQDDERFDDWNDAPSHAALAIRARLNERRLIRRNIKHVKALQEEIGIIIRVSVDELLAKMKAEAEAAAAAEAEAAAEFGANDNNEEAETDEHEEL